jgi:hypothetical protein
VVALGWGEPPEVGDEIDGVEPPETLGRIDPPELLEAPELLDGADADGFAAATPAANPPAPERAVEVLWGTVVAEPAVDRLGVCALRSW